MKVSESYDSEKVVALAASLSAAAAADAKVIKGLNKLDAKTNFSSNLDKEVGKKSEKTIEVSREFYESYVRQRTSLCALFEALQTNPPIYTSVSARAKAEDAFTNVAQDFDNAKKVEDVRPKIEISEVTDTTFTLRITNVSDYNLSLGSINLQEWDCDTHTKFEYSEDDLTEQPDPVLVSDLIDLEQADFTTNSVQNVTGKKRYRITPKNTGFFNIKYSTSEIRDIQRVLEYANMGSDCGGEVIDKDGFKHYVDNGDIIIFVKYVNPITGDSVIYREVVRIPKF